MKVLCERDSKTHGRREQGGARLNFLIVMVVICSAAYAGYQIVPVAYRAEAFQTFMQDTVNNAVYTGKNPAWVEEQLKKSFVEYDVPSDAVLKTRINDGRIEAQVQYTRAIPLAVTEYHYRFDKTVRSTNSLGGTP